MNQGPERRCVGCGARRPKPELLRLVVDPISGIVVDVTGCRPGRGAYLCADSRCRARAVANGSLARSLRSPGMPVRFENEGTGAA